MSTQQRAFVTEAHDGKITVQTEIPVSEDAGSYLVTITVEPQRAPVASDVTLDSLYGALAESPMPEVERDPLPEQRDDRCGAC